MCIRWDCKTDGRVAERARDSAARRAGVLLLSLGGCPYHLPVSARYVFRMFGRMSGQKLVYFLPIRQEKAPVCYSKNILAFVRHEPDIPENIARRHRQMARASTQGEEGDAGSASGWIAGSFGDRPVREVQRTV